MAGEAGKGDSPRSVDPKKWDAGYARIKWPDRSSYGARRDGGGTQVFRKLYDPQQFHCRLPCVRPPLDAVDQMRAEILKSMGLPKRLLNETDV